MLLHSPPRLRAADGIVGRALVLRSCGWSMRRIATRQGARLRRRSAHATTGWRQLSDAHTAAGGRRARPRALRINHEADTLLHLVGNIARANFHRRRRMECAAVTCRAGVAFMTASSPRELPGDSHPWAPRRHRPMACLRVCAAHPGLPVGRQVIFVLACCCSADIVQGVHGTDQAGLPDAISGRLRLHILLIEHEPNVARSAHSRWL